MGHNDPLLQILILLTASVCVVAAVRKLALPAILGYLAVGMLLGPHALALAADNETTRLLADFGVVFLVFTLGLEFSLPRLVAIRWDVWGVGGPRCSSPWESSRRVQVCCSVLRRPSPWSSAAPWRCPPPPSSFRS